MNAYWWCTSFTPFCRRLSNVANFLATVCLRNMQSYLRETHLHAHARSHLPQPSTWRLRKTVLDFTAPTSTSFLAWRSKTIQHNLLSRNRPISYVFSVKKGLQWSIRETSSTTCPHLHCSRTWHEAIQMWPWRLFDVFWHQPASAHKKTHDSAWMLYLFKIMSVA